MSLMDSNDADLPELRRAMGEAAALPPDDPQRREVEARIGAQGAWTRQAWQRLLEENERLRAELPRLTVAEDLEHRLLQVAVLAPRRRGWHRRSALIAVAVAAAVLVLAGGVNLYQYFQHRARLQTIALLAINNHLNHLDDDHLSIETSDRRKLETGLGELVSFPVRVPELGDALRLRGGRKCALGSHAVAYSLWLGPGGEKYSLFQFLPADFDVSSKMSRRLVHATEPAGTQHPCPAVIWADGHFGYVLVGHVDAGTGAVLP
jgi:hypothetical protein